MWLARLRSVELKSRGSLAGLNGRTTTRAASGRRWNACRLKNVFCVKVPQPLPRLGANCGHDAGRGASSTWADRVPIQRADLGQSEQIGDHRLPAPVLVGPTGMQAVAAASGFEV